MTESKVPQLNPDRLAIVRRRGLFSGQHGKPRADEECTACLMEAEAWVHGLKWTDRHPLISPVIGSLVRPRNDRLPSNEARDSVLMQFVGRLVGTAGSPGLERRRVYAVIDWALRIEMLAVYERIKLDDETRQAKLTEIRGRLRALPEIVDQAGIAPAVAIAKELEQITRATRATRAA